MLDWGDIPSVEQNAGTVSGTWVFKGTRVPLRTLFANLSDEFIAEFCCHFPTVTEYQVRTMLDHISDDLLEDAVTTTGL